MRKHLFDNHIQKWIDECEKLHIKITAKEALKAIAAHLGVKAESQIQRPRFTQERFINGLAELIFAHDLVCVIYSFSSQILLNIYL